ncbi:DUF4181 domain-containing protein [Fictibacillus sp. NRS-1165]|uniref:DUF4181 domain-containing protein n=1 Tax=Fictibacillus sp. NRS-1165 TaxID=3144463 RepID=UPI003D206AEB
MVSARARHKWGERILFLLYSVVLMIQINTGIMSFPFLYLDFFIVLYSYRFYMERKYDREARNT